MMAPVDDDGHVPPRLSSALGPATMTMTGSVGTCRQAAHGAATSDIGIGLPNRRNDDDDDDDNDYGDDGEASYGEGEEGSRAAWDRVKAFYWRNLGLLLFFLGQTFGSTMNTAAKLLTNNGDNPFHPLHIIFVRMVASTALGFTYTWYRRVPDAPLGPRNIRHLLLLRGLTGFVGLWGTYYSVTYMNLADAICISFLVPTLTAFVSYVWLREPYTPKEALAGIVALGGVVLVARPSFLFPPAIAEDIADANSADGGGGLVTATPAQRALAVLSAVAGAFGAAVAFTTIRVIGDRAHSLISVNYFALVATVVSTVLIVVHPDIGFALPRGSEQWILLLIIAVSGFMLQFLLTEGLKREKAGRATNMMYLQMVFALVVERVIWGTTPTFVSLLGASLIIGAAIWVSLQKSQATATTTAASRADELHQLQQQKRLAGLEDEENGLLNRRSRDPDSDDDSDDDDNGLRNDLRRQ